MPRLGGRSHGVGEVHVEHLGDRQCLLLAVVGRHHHARALLLAQGSEPRLLRGKAGLELRHLALDRVQLGPGGDAFALEPLDLEAELLLGEIDGPDLPRLDAANLGPQPRRIGQPLPNLGPRRLRTLGHHRVALAHLCERADQEAPLRPLDDGDVRRIVPTRHLCFVHPLEVRPVEVTVGDFQLDTVLVELPGDDFAVRQLAGHDLAIRERQAHHALRPEEPEAIVENEPDEPGHQQERDRQRPSGEPDEGLAPPPRLRQSRAHR